MFEWLESRLQLSSGKIHVSMVGYSPAPQLPDGVLQNIRVWIDTNKNDKLDRGERSGLTDAAGKYTFDHVDDGDCFIGMEVPGYPLTLEQRDAFAEVRAADGDNGLNQASFSFGVDVPFYNTVSGTVFFDTDQNGIVTYGSRVLDVGMPGVRVYMDLNGNQKRDKKEPQALTDSDGKYTLRNFRSDQKNAPIYVSTPAGYIATSVTKQKGNGAAFGFYKPQPTAEIDAEVAFSGSLTSTFDDVDPAVLMRGVRVYLDLDHDGRLDKHEPQALSRSDGRVKFKNLLPGKYAMRLSTPTGYVSDRTSVEIYVGDRQRRVQTFKLSGTRTVSFDTYYDVNSNGQRDANEAIINEYAWLTLTTAAQPALKISAGSEDDGVFRPAAIPPGAYTVVYHSMSTKTFTLDESIFAAGARIELAV